MWSVQQAPQQQPLLLMVKQQPDQQHLSTPQQQPQAAHLAALQSLPPLQAAQIQQPISQQQQQYVDQQYLLQQQLHQQQLTVHGQVAAQWQHPSMHIAEQPVLAAAPGASAATVAQATVDPTASYQFQQQQHMLQQQLLALQQQLASAPPASAQQLVQPVAIQQPQHLTAPMPTAVPVPAAPAPQWQHQQLYPQHQLQQQMLQPIAHPQPPPLAAAAGGPWQQQSQLVPPAAYAPPAPQQQQYQPAPMVRVQTNASAGSQQRAAARGSSRWQHRKQAGRQQEQPQQLPGRQPQQRDGSGQQRPQQESRSRPDLDKGQDRQQKESQNGRQRQQLPQREQQLRQDKQQQGRSEQKQQDDAADDFSFRQWQLQSLPWRTQARQQRETEDKQRHDNAQLKQPEQQGKRPQAQAGRQQPQQQQQPPNPANTARNRMKRHKKAANLQKRRLELAQQDQERLGKEEQRQQQQQKLEPQQQPDAGPPAFLMPLHRLPPRVISNIADRLNMNEKVALAEALPQTSAAAAAVYGVIHILQLKKGRMARICDVPGCVARMWGLRELAVTLWMDEEIQARTGLASLSSLAALTKMEISTDVLPSSRLLVHTKDDLESPNAKRRKFGALAPPPPTLTEQLSNQLADPAVKIQEEFWQITTALGKLTNLQNLSLTVGSCRSKRVFNKLGYQSLTPLSNLTRLASLHMKYDAAQAGSGLSSLSALTALSNLRLEEAGGTDMIDGEPAVLALSSFWPNATNLKRLQLRTQYLGPEVVRQLGLRHDLDVLDVSESRAFFPYFRTWGHLRRISGLQELHVSNCKGITAADVETLSSSFANSLSYLDISHNTAQPDGGDLRGSIDALGRLTNLQHLDAGNSCIAPAGDGSEGGVCSILAQLTKLTYLSVGSVMRSVMVIPAADVAYLSALTGLVKLSIAGAQLGVGLDKSTDTATLTAKFAWVRPLCRLSYIRLWACRFTHIPPSRVAALFCGRKISILKRQIRKYNCIVYDGHWYPNRERACHDEPADFSGNEDDVKDDDDGGNF